MERQLEQLSKDIRSKLQNQMNTIHVTNRSDMLPMTVTVISGKNSRRTTTFSSETGITSEIRNYTPHMESGIASSESVTTINRTTLSMSIVKMFSSDLDIIYPFGYEKPPHIPVGIWTLTYLSGKITAYWDGVKLKLLEYRDQYGPIDEQVIGLPYTISLYLIIG